MDLTDIVQLISLPMELIGVTLTLIEIFFAETNRKIEEQFDTIIKKADEIFHQYNSIIVKIIFGITLILMIIIIISSIMKEYETTTMNTLTLFVWAMLGWSIFTFFRSLLPSRTLLALGLTLTILGVLGEIYQVVNIFQ